MDITPIITNLVGLFFVILATILVPPIQNFIKTKLTTEQMTVLESVVSTAVKAAEQIYKNIPKSGKAKKAYVLEWLEAKGYDIDNEEINAYIEAKVNEFFGKVGDEE